MGACKNLCISGISLQILSEFKLLSFHGSVALQQHTRGTIESIKRLCSKFYTLSISEKILKFSQSLKVIVDYKAGSFFETQCTSTRRHCLQQTGAPTCSMFNIQKWTFWLKDFENYHITSKHTDTQKYIIRGRSKIQQLLYNSLFIITDTEKVEERTCGCVAYCIMQQVLFRLSHGD